MRAAVLERYGEPLQVADVPEPEPAEDEVLVRVRATGICGTDLKVTGGAFSHLQLPLIPGHEVAGEIAQDAGDLRRGQRVACYMYEPCGRCRLCRLGQGSLCPNLVRIGIERDGGLAELLSLPRANALPIADELPFETAAVSMDSVLTPWRALHGRAGVRAGETVAVIGAGGLGLNGVQIARAAQARVAVVDPVDSHRARAKEMGADLAVGPDEAEAIRDWSDGGVDLGLDTSGARSGFDTALALVRPGGRLVCCGYQPGVDYAFHSARLVLEEITLLGARAGSREDAIEVLRAVERGDVQPTIMDELPLEEINRALERLRMGDVIGRLVVRPAT